MKAKNWKFSRYVPDIEDVDAQCNAREAYFSLPPVRGRNDAEELMDAFDSGFIRGIAWLIAKRELNV